jgi:histidinol dehydrogenase
VLGLLDLRERGERLEPSRFESDPTVTETVRGIVERVREHGDPVLIELARRFDGAELSATGLIVTDDEFDQAESETPEELRAALDALILRLRDLHDRQLPVEWWDQRDGVRFGEVVRPLAGVGCYVPGGRAVYPSSVCMTVVPAVVAGVGQIVLCTPPQPDGSIPAAVLYAARKAGATAVVKSGGAQAVGALTFGTASVPAVDRIVGPGNVYVTEAKRQVAGIVGIDGLAGPSELAIVADATVDPALVALDLIAQAEHDPEARTFLIATEAHVIERVGAALDDALLRAGRREIVDEALARARFVLVRDLLQAAQVVDELAPEHLQLLVADPDAFLPTVRSFGAAFLGPWSAVPFGDYGVASNHVLPTAGTARFASGLRAVDFMTVRSVVEMTSASAARLAPETSTIARSEGLVGHAAAMDARTTRDDV